jgi:hypothetical protein
LDNCSFNFLSIKSRAKLKVAVEVNASIMVQNYHEVELLVFVAEIILLHDHRFHIFDAVLLSMRFFRILMAKAFVRSVKNGLDSIKDWPYCGTWV